MTAVRRTLGWLHLLAAGVLMLAVWLLLVVVASQPGLKRLWDLSPQAAFTVSQVTEQLLLEARKAELPLEFHTFLQPLPPGVPADPLQRQQAQILGRLQSLTFDLLRQYAYLGGPSVTVKHHDVLRPNDETRALANRFGVRGDSGDVIVVVAKGRHKRLSLEGDLAVIEYPAMRTPQGLPTSALPILKDYKGEEALSSAVKGLLVQGTPVLYLLKGYGEADRQSQTIGLSYGLWVQALEQEGFRVEDLDLGRSGGVPKDATVLALLEPRAELTERDAHTLHDWLRRGGRLLLVYSFLEIDERNPTGGELGRLLGLEVGRDIVFHLIPDPRRPGAPGLDGNPGVQRLDIQGLNPQHPITKPLHLAGRALQFAAGREIRRTGETPAGVRLEDLLVTGPWAWLGRRGPDGRPDWRAPGSEAAFAPRTLGLVADVDGPPDENGRPTATGHCVVLSGVAFANVGMPVNGDLALNIVNWLSERKELVTVRGDRYEARSLKVTPQQLDRLWWLLVVAVPGLLLSLGLFVKWRRSRI